MPLSSSGDNLYRVKSINIPDIDLTKKHNCRKIGDVNVKNRKGLRFHLTCKLTS